MSRLITEGWKYTQNREFPPEGVTVETTDSGGCHRLLVFERNLWWVPDRSMYVYFVPRSWRPVLKEEASA